MHARPEIWDALATLTMASKDQRLHDLFARATATLLYASDSGLIDTACPIATFCNISESVAGPTHGSLASGILAIPANIHYKGDGDEGLSIDALKSKLSCALLSLEPAEINAKVEAALSHRSEACSADDGRGAMSLEDLKSKVSDSILIALHSGKLEAQLEDALGHRRTFGSHDPCCSMGDAPAVLSSAELPSSQRQNAEAMLRGSLFDSLSTALDDGRLEHVVLKASEDKSECDDPQPLSSCAASMEVDKKAVGLKRKLISGLSDAVDSGELEKVLQQVQDENNAIANHSQHHSDACAHHGPGPETTPLAPETSLRKPPLRDTFLSGLESALDTGALEGVLRDIGQEADSPEPPRAPVKEDGVALVADVEELRGKLLHSFSDALGTGMLEDVLCEISNGQSQACIGGSQPDTINSQACSESMSVMRGKLFSSLTRSLDEGSLVAVLQQVGEEPEKTKHTRNPLLTAGSDPTSDFRETCRNQLLNNLLDAAESGALENIFTDLQEESEFCSGGSSENGQCQHEKRVADIGATRAPVEKARLELRNTFVDALADGRLQVALNAIAQTVDLAVQSSRLQSDAWHGDHQMLSQASRALPESMNLGMTMHDVMGPQPVDRKQTKVTSHACAYCYTPAFGNARASSTPANAVASSAGGVLGLVSKLSEKDRRVGELLVLIREAEQRLVTRDQQCRQMEGLLATARADLAHLELDVEFRWREFEGVNQEHLQLEAQSRCTNGGSRQEQLAQDRAKYVAGMAALGARSEVSTACGTIAGSLDSPPTTARSTPGLRKFETIS